jgi:hypothetical protein
MPLLALLSIGPGARAEDEVSVGKKLVEEHRCEICHNNRTMGDAKAIYLRKDRKVTSLEKLKSQVAMCNSQLNLQMFPEDEEHVAAYLNATYYKFPAKK